MRKNLTLFSRYTASFMLINWQIINYAVLAIRLARKQPIDILNNHDLFTDDGEDDKEIVIGAYEADYCVDFLKLIRKEFLFGFLKGQGKFAIEFEINQIFGLHERLFRKMLYECDFTYNREVALDKIVYVVS